jgi:hypothetical protein
LAVSRGIAHQPRSLSNPHTSPHKLNETHADSLRDTGHCSEPAQNS